MHERNEPLAPYDHRRLGRELDLFSFSDAIGGGLPLWHPKGALVRSLLEDFWRREHLVRGYALVYTPHVGRSALWATSGHLDFYHDSMYPPMAMEPDPYFVKPMNCPFHLQIFSSKRRSYRELPLRYAELGTVYRNEKSGVRHGLLRVRGFTQDDAHIICLEEHLQDEIVRVLDFARGFLAAFELGSLRFHLSTRPDKAVGSDRAWDHATDTLARSLRRAGVPYEVEPGGGAFYGPKLDVHARDAQGRYWQLSTVQFDFNLPERFDLSIIDRDGGRRRPFVVHRALFGSMERFFAILVEHYAGAFPLWLAPVQARVLPVAERHRAYAEELTTQARREGFRVEIDDRGEPLAARVRDGEIAKIPQLVVVGDREARTRDVSIRLRGNPKSRSMSTSSWLETLTRNGSPTGSAKGPSWPETPP